MNDTTLQLLHLFAWIYRFQTLRIAERYFRGAPGDRIVEVPLFGYRFPVRVGRSTTHRLLCLERDRFVAERHLLADLLRPGDTVLDVGANIGYYLLMFERSVGPRGRVVCIEPEPANAEELRWCISRNAFENVRVVEAAVGEVAGTVRLSEGLNGRVAPEGGVAVPMVTLDEFCAERPALVKIDVEGFEGQVLWGGRRLFAEAAPTLFVELHPHLLRYGYTASQVVDLVRPHYRTISFHEPARGNSAQAKLLARYRPRGGTYQIPDGDRLLRQCEDGTRAGTFWMICTR